MIAVPDRGIGFCIAAAGQGIGFCIQWQKTIDSKQYTIFAYRVKSYDVAKELKAKIINDIKPKEFKMKHPPNPRKRFKADLEAEILQYKKDNLETVESAKKRYEEFKKEIEDIVKKDQYPVNLPHALNNTKRLYIFIHGCVPLIGDTDVSVGLNKYLQDLAIKQGHDVIRVSTRICDGMCEQFRKPNRYNDLRQGYNKADRRYAEQILAEIFLGRFRKMHLLDDPANLLIEDQEFMRMYNDSMIKSAIFVFCGCHSASGLSLDQRYHLQTLNCGHFCTRL